jgi:predicted dehydrogenase
MLLRAGRTSRCYGSLVGRRSVQRAHSVQIEAYMKLNPVIAGRGMAGQAMERSLRIVETLEPEIDMAKPVFIERGSSLSRYIQPGATNLLCIANPHAYHTATLLEGVASGFDGVIVDKPVAISQEQVDAIRNITLPVGVCHGYRMMWGPQTIKEMCSRGDIGEVFSIEGSYLQSSSAQVALNPGKPSRQAWKNDPSFSGPSDALFDIGSHWSDMAIWLAGQLPSSARAKFSYVNAESEHRDSHVYLDFDFHSGISARATISKTFHGTSNNFEITALGSRGALTWRFLDPDEVVHGIGGSYSVIRRSDATFGSCQRPFHGTGWLEGYTEVIRQIVRRLAGLDYRPVPSLREQAALFDILLGLVASGQWSEHPDKR